LNAHDGRLSDSSHVYYFANAHGDSAWVYYLGAHGGHLWYFGDSLILSSSSYIGVKAAESLLASIGSVHKVRDSVRKAQDTANLALSTANAKADTNTVRSGLAAKLDTNGIAANSKLLQGQDTTALWNAKTLQGKDTTALWNAKTLQTKDTTALWNAKTLQGKDTTALKSLKSLPQSCDTASSATPTPNCDATDIYCLTAQAAAAAFAAPAGTPVNGQKLMIRIHDDGIARALTWNAAYRSRGATLLTTTTPGVTNYIGFIYNATESKWDCEAAN
jgi:hypothetical protein